MSLLFSITSTPDLSPPGLLSQVQRTASLAIKQQMLTVVYPPLHTAMVKDDGTIPQFPHISSWSGASLITP
jgi:hypothetical protein